ncbi:hypothetical protein GGR54DRAFT_532103 [Hypoxylon sp. NC1633]|nr:hypothetical protein GGR54DRAFT_532103 [Hypoxylon sp. NC1633]
MPSVKRPLPDPGDEIWEQNEPIIRQLYEGERKTLKQVKEIMEKEHGFPVIPLSTYETKLRDELRLRKKLKKDDWSAVYHHYLSRDGRDTAVYLNGSKIPWKKAWKEIRRSGARSTGTGQDTMLPLGIVVRTPSPAGHLTVPSNSAHQVPLPGPFSAPSVLPTPRVLRRGAPAQQSESESSNCGPVHFQDQRPSALDILKYSLEGNKVALRDIPFMVLKNSIISMAGIASQSTNGFERMLTSWLELDDTRYILGAILTIGAQEIRFPSTLSSVFNEIVPPTALTTYFDVYHSLANLIYLISNKLAQLNQHWDSRPDDFEILLGRIPRPILIGLFQIDLPIIRATWETLVLWAGKCGYRDTFAFLIDIGLRQPRWIVPRGSSCLSFAAAMGALDTIKSLLNSGIRADHQVGLVEIPAIIQAAATGNLDCLELLVEKCDVNRIIESYRDFSLENEAMTHALDILLKNGADINCPWMGRFGPELHPEISKIYQNKKIPLEWRPMLLEQSYYSDERLFHQLRAYDNQTTRRLIRPNICISAIEGKEALHEYLVSQPEGPGFDRTAFLELVLVEQFLRKDMNAEVIRALIECGVDPNLTSLPSLDINDLLFCLVHMSSMHGYNEGRHTILGLLLQLGAGIDSDVLEAGVQEEGVNLLVTLSQYGVGVNEFGSKALCRAARQNNYEAVSWLLEQGVDINSTVDFSIEELDTEILSWSVIAVASNTMIMPSKLGCYTQHTTYYDKDTGSCEMLKHLIDKGALLRNNPHDSSSFDFLHRLLYTTVHDGALFDKIQLFLDSGLDGHDLSVPGACLLEACLNPHHSPSIDIVPQRLKIYNLLIQSGAPIRDSRVLSSLIFYGGPHHLILELLEDGLDINAYAPHVVAHFEPPLTPVQAAASQGDKNLVVELIQRGADVNEPAVGSGGERPFRLSVKWNRCQKWRKPTDWT